MYFTLRLIAFFQTLATLMITRLLRPVVRVKSKRDFQFENDVRYMFVANHQSHLDAFAVFSSLTFKEMRMIAPIRFMTAGNIYYSYLYLFLALCGCYPTRKKNDPDYDPVARSIDYLEHGQNVFIFPEGRINLQSESKPRLGVKRIFDGTHTPFTVVLIHLEWSYKGKRRNLRVVFDKCPEIKSPESLMEQLYRL